MPRAASIRVDVKPALLRWARERAGLAPDELAHRFPRLADWKQEEARPTLRQLEQFAKATRTPIGYLFLTEPPVEHVPIPDFRTAGNRRIGHPSPDLLDTIYLCQQRQEWYRDFVHSQGGQPLRFVGSANLDSDIEMNRSGFAGGSDPREDGAMEKQKSSVRQSRGSPHRLLINQ
jgi:transcriptional regulator with XRE-family HTH domain